MSLTKRTQIPGFALQIGKRVKHFRLKAGLTRNQLRNAVGKSPQYVAHVEAGRFLPGIDIIQRMCDALGIKVWEFFQYEPPVVLPEMSICYDCGEPMPSESMLTHICKETHSCVNPYECSACQLRQAS